MSIRDQNLNEMTDEEIERDLNGLTYTGSPLYMGAISELTKRQLRKLTDAINKFSSESDKYSRRLVVLTWALVVLTVILVISTFFGIKDAHEQSSVQSNIALNSEFFTNSNTQIIYAIENNKPILIEDKGTLSDAQLDNYLGDFDTIESAYDDDSLSISDLCDSFSYYIHITSEDSEIQNYITQQRKIDPGFFTSLDDLQGITSMSKNPSCQ